MKAWLPLPLVFSLLVAVACAPIPGPDVDTTPTEATATRVTAFLTPVVPPPLQDTSGWMVLTNHRDGYQVKYPRSWVIGPGQSDMGAYLGFAPAASEDEHRVTLSISTQTVNELTRLFGERFEPEGRTIQIMNTLVNGVPATVLRVAISDEAYPDYKTWGVFIERDFKTYFLTLDYHDATSYTILQTLSLLAGDE